jgi:hypothetical protein
MGGLSMTMQFSPFGELERAKIYEYEKKNNNSNDAVDVDAKHKHLCTTRPAAYSAMVFESKQKPGIYR